jgi:hypothetical protein
LFASKIDFVGYAGMVIYALEIGELIKAIKTNYLTAELRRNDGFPNIIGDMEVKFIRSPTDLAGLLVCTT